MADLALANSTYQTGTNDTASTIINNVTAVDAAQMNGALSACVQIETILGVGTTLAGSFADLATRLSQQMTASGIVIPIGTVLPYAGSGPPAGYLMCDQDVSRASYPNLFAVLGTTYGAGDGSTTFGLPRFAGRIPVGAGTGAGGGASGTGVPTGGAALTAVSRGTWKGEETHTLLATENAAHTHSVTDPGHSHVETVSDNGGAGLAPQGANTAATGTVTIVSTNSSTTGITIPSGGGSNAAHNNIQPVMGINFIIKY